MNILDSMLFGIVAGLVSLKVVLLATAAMLLLYALTRSLRHRKAASLARHSGSGTFA